MSLMLPETAMVDSVVTNWSGGDVMVTWGGGEDVRTLGQRDLRAELPVHDGCGNGVDDHGRGLVADGAGDRSGAEVQVAQVGGGG